MDEIWHHGVKACSLNYATFKLGDTIKYEVLLNVLNYRTWFLQYFLQQNEQYPTEGTVNLSKWVGKNPLSVVYAKFWTQLQVSVATF